MTKNSRPARRKGEKEEKVKNPFQAMGLRPEHIDYHANNPADRILAWYMSGTSDPLSDQDEWYHHVFKTAHAAQIQGYTDGQTVKILRKYFDISEPLAYKYLYASWNLFGNMQASDKKAMRYMLSEILKSCIRRARKEGDLKAETMAARELAKINGLDKADTYIPDPSTLGGNAFFMQVNIGALGEGSEQLVLDLSKIDVKKEKLFQQLINKMDQAPIQEIQEMIDKEAKDYE